MILVLDLSLKYFKINNYESRYTYLVDFVMGRYLITVVLAVLEAVPRINSTL